MYFKLLLQTTSDKHLSDNLQKAGGATTPGVSCFVGLLHILQLVQVQSDLQYSYTFAQF